MKKTALLFGLLFAAWLTWSGTYSIPGTAHYHGLVLALGVVSCGVVVVLQRRMERQHDYHTAYTQAVGFITYVPWLFWQIVLSNLQIARVILSPSLPISPRLVRVQADLQTDFGWATLANSITLTPGTLSLDVRDGGILVHALTEATAQDLQSGTFARKVAALERSPVSSGHAGTP